jgi:hypothetical protein
MLESGSWDFARLPLLLFNEPKHWGHIMDPKQMILLHLEPKPFQIRKTSMKKAYFYDFELQ